MSGRTIHRQRADAMMSGQRRPSTGLADAASPVTEQEIPMVIKGQVSEAQVQRLAEGRCPVHGFAFAHIGGWYRLPEAETPCFLARCRRRTCDIHALQTEPGGPAVRLHHNVRIQGYPCTPTTDADGTVEWICGEDLVEVWPAGQRPWR
jgi:hypothetical protein